MQASLDPLGRLLRLKRPAPTCRLKSKQLTTRERFTTRQATLGWVLLRGYPCGARSNELWFVLSSDVAHSRHKLPAGVRKPGVRCHFLKFLGPRAHFKACMQEKSCWCHSHMSLGPLMAYAEHADALAGFVTGYHSGRKLTTSLDAQTPFKPSTNLTQPRNCASVVTLVDLVSDFVSG
jgi:hypothetical protein